jgi:hypothetical protein
MVSGFRAFSSSVTAICILFALVGCDGDTGLSGRQGNKGEKGADGIDSERVSLPAPRYLSIGIVNGSIHAVAATNQLFVTFDTAAHASSDTIVANRLGVPPLLDGIDGGIDEWGPHKSVPRLNPQPLSSSDDQIPDPHIYKVTCRVGFDDEYIYMFVQWKEITFSLSREKEASKRIVDAGESREENTLFLDVSHPEVAERNGTTEIDTIFTNLRVRQVVTLDSVCFPPPPLPPIICDYTYDTTYETLLVWRTMDVGEDKAAVCWSMEESATAGELPECVFASDSITLGNLVANELIDFWRWGAGTSKPVTVADDWSIRSGRAAPDGGQAPFVSNWVPSDSVPRYMNRLDPNHIVIDDYLASTTLLWYFDAVPYISQGWRTYTIVYVPGIIVTIPSRSRADVMARGLFSDDSWTLEFKRARNTRNADDLQF